MAMHINGQRISLEWIDRRWVATVGPDTTVTTETPLETMAIVAGMFQSAQARN